MRPFFGGPDDTAAFRPGAVLYDCIGMAPSYCAICLPQYWGSAFFLMAMAAKRSE
jgi:hypothetical protein